MASKFQQLQSKACQAKQFITKHSCALYKQTLEQNKQYIVEPPTVEKCNELSKQLFYTRLASVPKLLFSPIPPESHKYIMLSFSILKFHVMAFVQLFEMAEATKLNGILLSIPTRNQAFWKELDYVKQAWKNRHELKVEDAGIAALFGLECFAWYCAGEIVGRGFTFTGYYP
nr:Transcription initiation factor TFIID subunit taf73 [Ipomoea batatas]